MSVFPALGAIFGIAGIAGGALYLVQTALQSPFQTTVTDLSSATVIMLGCCVAGLAVLLIAGLTGVAGGEQR